MFRRLSCEAATLQFANLTKLELNSDKSPQTLSHPPPCQPNRANLQKCINQTGLFPSLTVSAESDLCDKNQAALNALPQLPFPGKCINFVGGWTGLSSLYQINRDRCPIIWKLFFYSSSMELLFPVLPPRVFLLHFAGNRCRGRRSDIPNTQLFHALTQMQVGVGFLTSTMSLLLRLIF